MPHWRSTLSSSGGIGSRMSDSDMAGGDLAFRVLGPLEATYAGLALPLGGGRQRAVLALLVCEVGHPVPSNGWSTGCGARRRRRGRSRACRPTCSTSGRCSSPGAPVARRAASWSRCRADTGSTSTADASTWRASRTAWPPATPRWSGASRTGPLAAYSEALSLWRGDVLADLSDYDFVAPLRARLDELRASALQSRIQAELDLGHHLAVVAELGALLSETSPARGFPRPAHPRVVPLGPAVRRAGRLPRAARPCWTPSWASNRARRCRSSTTRVLSAGSDARLDTARSDRTRPPGSPASADTARDVRPGAALRSP